MSPTYLIFWSCGPIQDFIEAARKGRDLWFGSWLLSEVSTSAALTFFDAGGELLLPSSGRREELLRADFDVANRVLVRVSTDEPAAVARVASAAARERIAELARACYDDIDPRPRSELFDRKEAELQVRDVLDVAWAVVPCTSDERQDRARVAAILAARKTTRSFVQPAFTMACVPKNSLDGRREAVTRKGAGMRLGLTHDERLCGIGLLKRLGHRIVPDGAPGGRLTSVSAFAVQTWLRPALVESPEGVAEAVRAFADELRDSGRFGSLDQPIAPVLGSLDAHAFYVNRVHELLADGGDLARALQAHAEAFSRLLDRIEASTKVRLPRVPNPYYAILLGDGDRLGKFLDELKDHELARVSRALSEFAGDVRNEVFAPTLLKGACVYAGGDDVLALVPVDVALERARVLSNTFSTVMKEVRRDLGRARDLPTFSVGICVAHHLVPLQQVLAGVRRAEGIAKDVAGRNAWALRLHKRSGAPIEIHGRWGATDERLVKLTQASGRSGPLPRGLAHELLEAARFLGSSNPPLERCELQRILSLKNLESMGQRDELFSELEQLQGSLQEQLQRNPDALTSDQSSGLERLAERLVVARALAGMGAS